MVCVDEIQWVAFSGDHPPCQSPASVGLPVQDDFTRRWTAADLVIAALADAEVEALAHVAELTDENSMLREMRSVALELLARSDAHLQVARATIGSLRVAERQRVCGLCRRTAA